MKKIEKILSNYEIPEFFEIKQELIKNTLSEKTIDEKIKEEIYKYNLENKTIAITAGSRGISCLSNVLLKLINELKRQKALPFIVPAMGSHGGATAEGQKKVLADFNITEETMGVPIKSSIETIEIGKSKYGLPVYIDKYAFEADFVIVMNRIKSHTSFSGEIESGLQKMMVIGLGNQKGAQVCHNQGYDVMARNIKANAEVILKNTNILFCVGIIENSYHELEKLVFVNKNDVQVKEPLLLAEALALEAKLPIDKLDLLIIQEIGKDISGTGMDTNVIGRYHSNIGKKGVEINKIIILDIRDVSEGNFNGLGLADITTKRVYNKLDFEKTYTNALTANLTVSSKIPMVMDSDLMAIKAGMKTVNSELENISIMIIKNTLNIEKIWASKNLYPVFKNIEKIKKSSTFFQLDFDNSSNLKTFIK